MRRASRHAVRFKEERMRRDSHAVGSIGLALSCSCNPLVLVLVASILVCGSAMAAERSCPNPEPVPLSVLLLAPPCDRCNETKAELSELRALEKLLTPAQAEHAVGDYERSIERFLGESGVKMRADQLGFASDFFECINEIVGSALRDAKAKFNRTRPYKIPDNGLHVLKALRLDDSPSYPSGHAAYGTVVGLILADMVPELREQIYERIRDYGFSRLRVGVHFRSDIYAGEIAGAAITASLYRNREFQEEFERVKPGLRAALGY
jgi:acid phosphatase (class A)